MGFCSRAEVSMIYASLDNPLMRAMKKGIDRQRKKEEERLFIIRSLDRGDWQNGGRDRGGREHGGSGGGGKIRFLKD